MYEVTLSNHTDQIETIKTEHLAVSLTRKPGCHLKLTITVSPAATQAAYAKAVKAINKEISIPGFRKGKAPDAIVIQRFEPQIKKEWHDVLLNTSFSEFLNQTHLYPYASIQQSIKRAEIKSVSKEAGAELLLEYEARPTIPTVDTESLQLKPVTTSEVTAEAIEETLHQIQLKLGTWNKITDRPVEEGDFVDLDIEALENPPRSICQDMRFEVAQGRMGNWMKKLIIGKSVNETVEGMSEIEESMPIEAEEDFKPTLCRITIKEIMTSVLPPLDDELAKKVGLQTIDELKPKVEQDLQKRAEDERKDQLRAQVENLLLEKYDFDIPASLIATQIKETIDHRLLELKKHEHSKEHLKTMAKEIEANAHIELNRAYRLYFLTRKIAEENNIGVFENELMSEMFKQMMLPEGQAMVSQGVNTDEVRSKLFVNVLSKKVLDFLAEKANYIEAQS
jgi:trigger factor